MRLFNCYTFIFKEFYSDIPPYLILSHRWGDEEPTYQDFAAGKYKANANAYEDDDIAADSPGVRKVFKFCQLSRSRDCQWIWIDTICINKQSSAELSEAINSMYRWYEDARSCIVFLQDVTITAGEGYVEDAPVGEDDLRAFAKSRWFTRGWTLQELLAPPIVRFYDARWRFLGSKRGLRSRISSVTGIDEQILRSRKPSLLIARTNINMKMAWFGDRQCTRIEDIAYCLLGIFGVNMYLLYGEGRNAFQRLQRKLLKMTGDESLLAWKLDNSPQYFSGIFAPHPCAFKSCTDVVSDTSVRNRLRIMDQAVEFDVHNSLDPVLQGSTIILPLRCVRRRENGYGSTGTLRVVIETAGIVLTNLHGEWYRRANTDVMNTGTTQSFFKPFSEAAKPEKILRVKTSIDELFTRIGIGLTCEEQFPMAIRFKNHILTPERLLTSMSKSEMALYAENAVASLLPSAEVQSTLQGHNHLLPGEESIPIQPNVDNRARRIRQREGFDNPAHPRFLEPTSLRYDNIPFGQEEEVLDLTASVNKLQHLICHRTSFGFLKKWDENLEMWRLIDFLILFFASEITERRLREQEKRPRRPQHDGHEDKRNTHPSIF